MRAERSKRPDREQLARGNPERPLEPNAAEKDVKERLKKEDSHENGEGIRERPPTGPEG